MELDLTIILPPDIDAMWTAILAQKRPRWTASEPAELAGCSTKTMSIYLQRLVAAGFAERQRVGRRKLAYYRVVRRPKTAPRLDMRGKPTVGPVTERLWLAMRLAKTFSAAELAAMTLAATAKAARRYCDELVRVGILVGGADGYRLVRDLGPKAPKMVAIAVVIEANSGTMIGFADTREVQP